MGIIIQTSSGVKEIRCSIETHQIVSSPGINNNLRLEIKIFRLQSLRFGSEEICIWCNNFQVSPGSERADTSPEEPGLGRSQAAVGARLVTRQPQTSEAKGTRCYAMPSLLISRKLESEDGNFCEISQLSLSWAGKWTWVHTSLLPNLWVEAITICCLVTLSEFSEDHGQSCVCLMMHWPSGTAG